MCHTATFAIPIISCHRHGAACSVNIAKTTNYSCMQKCMQLQKFVQGGTFANWLAGDTDKLRMGPGKGGAVSWGENFSRGHGTFKDGKGIDQSYSRTIPRQHRAGKDVPANVLDWLRLFWLSATRVAPSSLFRGHSDRTLTLQWNCQQVTWLDFRS